MTTVGPYAAPMTEDVGDLHVATVVANVQDMPRAVVFWGWSGSVRRG